MRRGFASGLVALGGLFAAPPLYALELQLHPERPRLGDLVLVFAQLEAPLTRTGTITAFGYQFAIMPSGAGPWRGAVAVPVDVEPGDFDLVVQIGAHRVARVLSVEPRSFRRSELKVNAKFTREAHPKPVQARIERESRRWARMLEASPSPPVPLGSAVRPTAGPRTSEFGVQRVLNGKVESQHYGLDLDGRVGDPVWVQQTGVVRLSAERFYSGGTLVLDHGHGLYSAYFHLSRRRLRVGDRVAAGARLGEVGRSGRVTGPHLHLSLIVRARALETGQVRGLYVDPEPWLEGPWGPATAL